MRRVWIIGLALVCACSVITNLDKLGSDAGDAATIDAAPDIGDAGTQTTDARCDRDSAFGTPTPVLELHDPAGLGEISARLTAAELDVFYTHLDDAGGASTFTAHKDTLDAGFKNVALVNLDASFSAYPSVTASGLDLYVEFAVGVGDYAIYHATRTSLSNPFAPPLSLAVTDSPTFDGQPYVAPDGTTELYFAHGDGGSGSQLSIYVASYSGGSFVNPMPVAGISDSKNSQHAPVITRDRLTLYFASAASGGGTADDIFVAKRADVTSAFGAATAVTSVSSLGVDVPNWISEDECVMVLHSNRTGPFQIFRAARSP